MAALGTGDRDFAARARRRSATSRYAPRWRTRNHWSRMTMTGVTAKQSRAHVDWPLTGFEST
jgi:hypothetical protein